MTFNLMNLSPSSFELRSQRTHERVNLKLNFIFLLYKEFHFLCLLKDIVTHRVCYIYVDDWKCELTSVCCEITFDKRYPYHKHKFRLVVIYDDSNYWFFSHPSLLKCINFSSLFSVFRVGTFQKTWFQQLDSTWGK